MMKKLRGIVANSERDGHLFNESIRIVSLCKSVTVWFVTSELCERLGGFSLSSRGFCLSSDTSKPPNRMWRSKTVASAPWMNACTTRFAFPYTSLALERYMIYIIYTGNRGNPLEFSIALHFQVSTF